MSDENLTYLADRKLTYLEAARKLREAEIALLKAILKPLEPVAIKIMLAMIYLIEKATRVFGNGSTE